MGGEMPDADGKSRGADSSSAAYGHPPSAPPQQPHLQYGTFGAPSGGSGQFPQPAVGFPQPAPPPGMQHYPQPPPASYAVYPPPPQQPYSAAAPYYAQGYQAVQGTWILVAPYNSNYVVLLDRLLYLIHQDFSHVWLVDLAIHKPLEDLMDEAVLVFFSMQSNLFII